MNQPETEPAEASGPEAADVPLPRIVAQSAIVLRADQEEFDDKQLSTLALISPGLASAPRGHLAMFFHYCVRSGLDPFARQIYMIGRKNRGEDREDRPVNWTIQTGIDGFRTIAHRAAERTGERISYEDTVYYDAEGTSYDVWLQPGPPAAVKVVVLRGTSRFPFIARWAEFAPTYWDAKENQYVVAKMWRTMPAHMIRKCAEAGGLRMAAPQDLSGVYVDEEMAQADAEVVAGLADDATERLRAAAGLAGEEPKDPKADDVAEAEAQPAPKRRKQPRATGEPAAADPPQAEEGPRPRPRRTPRKRPTGPAATS